MNDRQSSPDNLVSLVAFKANNPRYDQPEDLVRRELMEDTERRFGLELVTVARKGTLRDLEELLKEYNTRPNYQSPPLGETALMAAAARGQDMMGMTLIRAGALVNLIDRNVKSAFDRAAGRWKGMADLLKRHGAKTGLEIALEDPLVSKMPVLDILPTGIKAYPF